MENTLNAAELIPSAEADEWWTEEEPLATQQTAATNRTPVSRSANRNKVVNFGPLAAPGSGMPPGLSPGLPPGLLPGMSLGSAPPGMLPPGDIRQPAYPITRRPAHQTAVALPQMAETVPSQAASQPTLQPVVSQIAADAATTRQSAPAQAVRQSVPRQPAHQHDPGVVADRVRGAIIGSALGDALGLPCHGSDAHVLSQRYQNGLALPFKASTRGYPLNDWTSNTDMTVLMMRTMVTVASNNQAQPQLELAHAIARWKKNGFREIGDSEGHGCGALTHNVANHPEFLTNPLRAAQDALGPKTGNEALARTLPIATNSAAEAYAGQMCMVTHSDPQCIASCVFQTLLLRSLIIGFPPSPDLIRLPAERASAYLTGESQRKDMMHRLVESGNLPALELGSRDQQGFTFKSLSAGMWAYRQLLRAIKERNEESKESPEVLFKRVVSAIALQGGDSSTNASIAGALVGSVIGFSRLPKDWFEATPNYTWLNLECSRFLEGIGFTNGDTGADVSVGSSDDTSSKDGVGSTEMPWLPPQQPPQTPLQQLQGGVMMPGGGGPDTAPGY